MNKFVFRGHNTFYFKRKKWPLENLRCRMALHRTTLPGGGGCFSKSGDGEAWFRNSDVLQNGWFMRRKIIKGQWSGPWQRIKNNDV